MIDRLSRREFVLSGAAAVPLVRSAVRRGSPLGAPAVLLRPPAQPCVVASRNGIRGVARAMELLSRGTDTLDAVVEAVKIQ